VFWDKVVEVTTIGHGDVFDLSVEGADSYVAHDIWVCSAI
jgi:intein/homing endonuclease